MTGGLVWAIKNGDLEQVKELVDKQVNYFNNHLKMSLKHPGTCIIKDILKNGEHLTAL